MNIPRDILVVVVGCATSGFLGCSDPGASGDTVFTTGGTSGTVGGAAVQSTVGGAAGAGAGAVSGLGGAGTVPTTSEMGVPTSRPRSRIGSSLVGTCALDAAGELLCWGAPDGYAWPSLPKGPFIDLAASSEYYCALRADGTRVCFIDPYADTTGLPADDDTGTYSQVDVGEFLKCGLTLSEGTIHCWHSMSASRIAPLQPTNVVASVVAAWYVRVCAIQQSDKSLLCWGLSLPVRDNCDQNSNLDGELQPPAGEFVQIDAGFRHACALRVDGAVVCWGHGKNEPNNCGALRSDFGQAVPPAGTFKFVASGRHHSCAVRVDGTVACWGAGTVLGDCSPGLSECGQSLPPPDNDFIQVAPGYTHTCGLKANGKVKCWGSNTGGRSTPPLALQ